MSQFNWGLVVEKAREERVGTRHCGRTSFTLAHNATRRVRDNSQHVLESDVSGEEAVKPASNRGGGIVVTVG